MINKKYENFYDKLSELKKLLHDEDIYYLATALRCNDFNLLTIKYVFTARLRLFIIGSDYFGLVRFTKYINDKDVEHFINELEELRKDHISLHYFNHIDLALRVLQKYELIEEWEYGALQELLLVSTSYLISKEDKNIAVITVRNALNKLVLIKGDVK